MTLRIETASGGRTATLRLIGRIESESLDELQAQVRRHRPRLVLDLDEVTLLDAGVVRFLIACEEEGIEGIRVEACGICHTDAATVTGRFPGLNLPRVP